MDTPTIHQIKAMPKKDLDALNQQLMKKLAVRMVGFVFLKIAVVGVTKTLAKQALIEAAKRA